MKKIILISILSFVASMAIGQIALRGGVNYSSVKVSGSGVDLGEDPKVGFHAGLQGDISVLGIRLRPALLYHIKGGRPEAAGSIGNTNLHYLEVPLNVGLKIGGDAISFIAEAGPYFGYLLNTSSGVSDIDDRIGKSDLGINFGGVVNLGKLGIGANYSNSLTSISTDTVGQGFKTKNGNLALFALINF